MLQNNIHTLTLPFPKLNNLWMSIKNRLVGAERTQQTHSTLPFLDLHRQKSEATTSISHCSFP
jgi:hypothetical protein